MNTLSVEAQYSAYVKDSVRAGRRPLNPDAWLAATADVRATIETHAGGGGNGAEPPNARETGGGDERGHAERVRAAFLEILWISGYTKPLSLFESARHRIKLGDPLRANHVRPTAPCPECNDQLCAWAP